MKNSKARSREMSDMQKAAMAQGRTASRAVGRYLEALMAHSPKRGRKRTPDGIEKRLSAIEAALPTASPISKLAMIQERLDLQAELDAMQEVFDITEYETAFVAAAKDYSERKGITYSAWRELGVHPAVLRRAGISRS